MDIRPASAISPSSLLHPHEIALAIAGGDEAAAVSLIAAGASLHAPGLGGSSPLCMAIEAQMWLAARSIVHKSHRVRSGPAKDAIFQGPGDSRSALALALMREESDLAIAMAMAGAPVNGAQNSQGMDPLMIAIESVQEPAALALIHVGADPAGTNASGESCLSRAIALPLSAAALSLIEKISRGPSEGRRVFDLPDRRGLPPLSAAIDAQRAPEALALIGAGAALDGSRSGPRPPLLLAIDQGLDPIALAMVHRSAQALPGEPSCLNSVGSDGCCALAQALRLGREPVALALIRAGADLGLGDEDGSSILCVAIKSSMPSAARAIVAASSNRPHGRSQILDSADASGVAAIAWAARRGWEALIMRMINAGASVDGLLLEQDRPFWRDGKKLGFLISRQLSSLPPGQALPIDEDWLRLLEAGEDAQAAQARRNLGSRSAAPSFKIPHPARLIAMQSQALMAAKSLSRSLSSREDLLAIEERQSRLRNDATRGSVAKAASARSKLRHSLVSTRARLPKPSPDSF